MDPELQTDDQTPPAIDTGEQQPVVAQNEQPAINVDTGDSGQAPVPGAGQAYATPSGPVGVEDDASGVDKAVTQQEQAPGGLEDNRLPQDPMAIRKMLAGEGAVNPSLLQRINDQARRGLQDTPADAGVYAIHDALEKHGPDAAAAIVQANRVAHDSKSAYALQALNGTANKRPDLKAAIDAANQAQDHMPDGSNVIFSPNGNHGVIAVATPPGSTHSVQFNLNLQQFKQFLDVGGDGQFDKKYNAGTIGTIQRLANATTDQTDAGDTPGSAKQKDTSGEGGFGAFPSSDALKKVGVSEEDQSDVIPRGGVKASTPKSDDDDEEGDTTGKPANGNAKVSKGQDQDIADAQRRAYKLFPWMSQAKQRAAFIQSEVASKSEEAAKLEQERVKGVNMTDRQRLQNEGRLQYGDNQNQSREKIAEGRNATWKYATDQKRQAAQQRIQQLYDQEARKDARSAKTNELGILKSKIAAGTINDDDNQRLRKYGAAADQQFDAGGGNAPKAATPGANKPQQGQVSLPPVNSRVAGQTIATGVDGKERVWGEDGKWHLTGG